MPDPTEQFEFGPFLLDVRERRLLRGETPVPLTAKAFDTLLVLLRSAGSVVSRGELMERVWPGTFVEESNLAQNISMIRRALAVEPAAADYIETVPKIGYRFRAEVGRLAPFSADTAPASAAPPALAPRPVWKFAAAAAILAALTAAAWFASRRVSGPSRPPRIAVIGFSNQSADPKLSWFDSALAEMLDTELNIDGRTATVPGEDIARMRSDLGLRTRTGFAADTLRRIRDNTGAGFIVSGSYAPADRGIRLDLRLQNTMTGETTGVFAFSAPESRLAEIAEQAALAIRGSLGLAALTGQQSARARDAVPPAPAREAYYAALERLRVPDAQAAQALFSRAVAAAPAFAPAHLRLSEAWSALGFDTRALEEAKIAFELSAKASRIDNLTAEGRYRVAAAQWPRAIEIFRSLWTIEPDHADFGLSLASAQISAGRYADASATLARLASAHSPENAVAIRMESGELAFARGDFSAAVAEFGAAASLARARGARSMEGRALSRQARAFQSGNHLSDATAAWRAAESLCSAVGDKGCIATALETGAEMARLQRNFGESRTLINRAIALQRELNDRRGLVTTLDLLGKVESLSSQPAAASAATDEAIAIARDIGANDKLAALLTRVASRQLASGNF